MALRTWWNTLEDNWITESIVSLYGVSTLQIALFFSIRFDPDVRYQISYRLIVTLIQLLTVIRYGTKNSHIAWNFCGYPCSVFCDFVPRVLREE